MRMLILLRGLPGSGKSTFIKDKNLQPYTLSSDSMRLLYGSPVLQANGSLRIPAEYDRIVWEYLFKLLDSRMKRGELVIVDATHVGPRSFVEYRSYADKYRYQTLCVDFSGVPADVCEQRNISRAEYSVVPPDQMKRMKANLQRTNIPDWITAITPEDYDKTVMANPEDVSQYKAVHHIGDVQGCFDPLNEYFVVNGIKDDELYIFIGDYLDRGSQNAAVMKWLLKNYQRPNFIFIEGNHEAHLRNWVRGIEATYDIFNKFTAPELEAGQIDPKEVQSFLQKLRDMYYYTFNDKMVLVTHGGISNLPANLAYIGSIQFIRGAGAYEEADISDVSYALNAPDNAYQIHGHRNLYSTQTKVNDKCYNLEGKVEFGGELRVVVIDKKGFHERPIKSKI